MPDTVWISKFHDESVTRGDPILAFQKSLAENGIIKSLSAISPAAPSNPGGESLRNAP